MSPKSAGLAKKWGYTNIGVYVQGEPAWKEAGFMTTSTPEHVKTANIVLVDLRSPDVVKAGHIPGAVGMSISKLAGSGSEFPSYKGAQIIFYSDNREDLKNAVESARKWGYNESTVFLDGISAWEAEGYSIEKGPAAAKITYARKIGPDEINIGDFEKALKSGTAVIVDVRTPEEHKKGHFRGSLNIPVDEIASKYAEIPKDRTIYTHCVTGVRAEMALNILKEKGYNVKFLKAQPKFNNDGTYSIME